MPDTTRAQILGFIWILLGLAIYWLRRGTRSGAAEPSFDEQVP